MKNQSKWNRFFIEVGIDFKKFLNNIPLTKSFIKDYLKFKKQYKGEIVIFPSLSDFNVSSGISKSDYFIQDTLVSSLIYKSKPKMHLDVGSRIDGFISIISLFLKVKIIDIRPLEINNENISFIRFDFTKKLPQHLIEKFESVSCLHTLEHIGLGRYKDQIDSNGYKLFLNNLFFCVKKGGKIYLSTIVGEEKVIFNTHRIFDLKKLVRLFPKNIKILNKFLVDKNANLIELDKQNIKMDNELGNLVIFEM
ncbi:DUF268 domain-containing protein, partial [Flavobacteriaceae bacterium]|nr:DUF268 domain-containing protein [Flavobacteriaceae bacterium]